MQAPAVIFRTVCELGVRSARTKVAFVSEDETMSPAQHALLGVGLGGAAGAGYGAYATRTPALLRAENTAMQRVVVDDLIKARQLRLSRDGSTALITPSGKARYDRLGTLTRGDHAAGYGLLGAGAGALGGYLVGKIREP